MRGRGAISIGLWMLCWLAPAGMAAPHRRRVHPNPSITILAIVPGPDGFLWLAAQDGLYRFDGFHYQKLRDCPLPSTRKAVVTPDGSVWIGGAEGLVRYQGGRFRSVLRESVVDLTALPDRVLVKAPPLADREVLLDGSIAALSTPLNLIFTLDPAGGLWASSMRESLAVRTDPGRPGKALEEVRLPGTFEQVMRDSLGRVWAADATRAVQLSNGRPVRELTRRHSQRTQRGYPLLSGRNGQVWFIGETVTGLEPPVEFRERPANDQYQPTAAYEDERGRLWVAKLGLGLVEWIPDARWQRWPSDEFGGMPASQAWETPGGFVLATHANIYRLESLQGAWRAIARETREYAALLPLEDGGFLASIRRAGLVRLDARGETVERPPNPLPSADEYRLLARDGRGRNWVGNKMALFEITGKPGALRLRREDPPGIGPAENAQAIDMELDRAGNLWLGYAKGIARRDDLGNWRRIPTEAPLNDVRSFTLADRDNGEDIWVAYRHNGPFARLRKSGERWSVTHFAASAGYGPDDTHFIKRDSRGWIWRGSPDGVHVSDGIHVEPRDWLHFSPGNGLSTRSTGQFGFFEDKEGAVWIAGEDGVTRMMPEPAWFGVREKARLQVSRLEVDGVEIAAASQLPAAKRSISIAVGSLDTAGTRDYPVRYRVRPRTEKWSYSRDATIELSGLEAGEHTLEVGLTGGNGSEVMALPFRAGGAGPSISWLWLLSVPAGGGLALLGPWFPWSERARYRLKKELFLLHRRFSRKESSGGGPNGPVRDCSGRILAGRYRVLRAISQGGFSVVYEAEDMQAANRKVAVKVLNASPANEGWLRDRFAHEVAALRSVEHRAVVRILDSWVSPEGEPCLVMPMLEGPTLRQALRDGPLPAHRAAVVVREVGAALAEVHARGVVHRDLKPENVILTGEGAEQPVVIDFGTASLRGRQDELAATTMLSGSFHYMAPERLSGHYSAESDVYSFAVIILEMVTGKRLADLRVLFSDDTFQVDLIDAARGALPPELARVFAGEVAKAYDPKPQRRPAEVRAWSEGIAQLLERA